MSLTRLDILEIINNQEKTISNEEYHKHPALSCSGLKQFIKSPAHYKQYMVDKSREGCVQSTPAMVLGSYIHTIILEPEKAKKEYAILPEGLSLATKDGKQWKSENEGKQVIKYSDYVTALQMRDQVKNNEMCKIILSNGDAEISIFWKDEDSRVECRCRPDYINHELQLIIDLKSTIDASPESFQKASWNMLYHLQAPFYQRGVLQKTGKWYDFIFIAIEKDNPYLQPVIYKPDTDLLRFGDGIINDMLPKFYNCLTSDIWEGYSTDIQTLSAPAWAKI